VTWSEILDMEEGEEEKRKRTKKRRKEEGGKGQGRRRKEKEGREGRKRKGEERRPGTKDTKDPSARGSKSDPNYNFPGIEVCAVFLELRSCGFLGTESGKVTIACRIRSRKIHRKNLS